MKIQIIVMQDHGISKQSWFRDDEEEFATFLVRWQNRCVSLAFAWSFCGQRSKKWMMWSSTSFFKCRAHRAW